ncbi:hypothetical protein BDB01DRAFT_265068 [Pilobolus umbonatus]|nr:hypothetical protein BDB01DRAFT_265068 [Pilobolus umbonatus]
MSKAYNDTRYAPLPTEGEPSAPSIHEIPPPSYDEALKSSITNPTAPPVPSDLDGYVLDSTTQPCVPDVIGNTDCSHTSIPVDSEHYRGRPLPPNYSIYKADYTVTKEGVISRDKHINQDGEALVQFLYQHNSIPKMEITFHGYHDETVWVTKVTTDNNGESRHVQEPCTRRVEDFLFSVDCSDEVSPICQGMYVLPDPKTGEVKSIRQLCDEYVREKNSLKELHMDKVIHWDYDQLTKAFTAAIRSSGYYQEVDITFERSNHKVTVKTDTSISRFADNKVVRFFFFITCLWIIAYPLLLIFRKRFGHSTLKSGWIMKIPEREFYERNVQTVIGRCRGNRFYSTSAPYYDGTL